MKKILVTGCTGFIGNYVIEQLLKNGCHIIATSSNKQKAMQAPWFNRVNFIPLNLKQLSDATDYYRFFDEPEFMIHLAWEGLPNYNALFHFEENLPRHYSFLKNLIVNGLNDLTVTGTCLEYGMLEGCLSEDLVTSPANPYAVAKDTLRKFLQELQKVKPYILKWIRLFYMYGKGQNPNSLFSQLDNAIANEEKIFNMSGGEQVRDYLPVENVAEYVKAITLQQKVTGIINCSSNQPITVKELVEKYLREKNQNMSLNLGYYPYTSYEPMHFWGDNNKLKTILNNEEPY